MAPGTVTHRHRPAHSSSGGTDWPPLPPVPTAPARSPLTHLNRLGQNGAAAGDGGAPGGHQRHGRGPARVAPARTPRASHGQHQEPPGCRCHRPGCRPPRPSPGGTWDLASLVGRRRDRRCACAGRGRAPFLPPGVWRSFSVPSEGEREGQGHLPVRGILGRAGMARPCRHPRTLQGSIGSARARNQTGLFGFKGIKY